MNDVTADDLLVSYQQWLADRDFKIATLTAQIKHLAADNETLKASLAQAHRDAEDGPVLPANS
jgi:hypothetical protein